MKFITIGLIAILGSYTIFAKDLVEKKEEDNKSFLGAIQRFTPDKDEILGKLLQQTLENVHFSHKKIGDDLSKKAFKVYLERIDYGKQFLLEDDVEKLEKYKTKFDDQLVNGDLSIIRMTQKMLQTRIPMVATYVDTILKKDFDFKKKETYETDAKKREFADTEKELKDRWKRLVKLEVLIQYFDLKDEQDGVNQKHKKKKKTKKIVKTKKKKEKKKTFKELMLSSREKVAKRYKRVFTRLQKERKGDQLDKFYNSITKVYDPHTLYLIPEEKADFDIDMSGKLEGIGALLREEGSFIKVERIIPGSASWRGKELKAEDVILAVAQGDKDSVDIVDMSIRDAVKLIRGAKGTIVKLKVKRPDGSTKIIAIKRDQVVLEESYVKSTIIEHKDLKQKIGYIHVPKFYRDFQDSDGRNSSTDVKNEIIKLKKKKVDGIILNLRNNGGGALQDATLMGGLFIDKGPIVQVKNRGDAKVQKDIDGVTYWDKPLVILINRFSASASEIVAGALKDYKRAILVGSSEQTHGKGTVQAILGLQDYLNPYFAKAIGPIGAMKITTDMFYRVNGQSTQFRGVKPDIALPDQFGYLESGEKHLDYAIPYAEIAKVPYKLWTKQKYDVESLKKKSSARVAKNTKFQKILKSVKWSKERKDDTKRVITLEAIKKFRTEATGISDKYKTDEISKKVSVQSISKLKNDVEKERFKEFQEELQKDPVIEESLHIFNDMFKS
ncbi:MAG: carboxy terminal-processing peptidase [Halobacteriovoraceae bacterium]|jgi:carboxyl-terminal processing protease|nr:carboxy terminal-processing peptidase [Halobacteriovoraceae bacterium]